MCYLHHANAFCPRHRTVSLNRQGHVGSVKGCISKNVQLSSALELNKRDFCRVHNLLCLPSRQTIGEGHHAGYLGTLVLVQGLRLPIWHQESNEEGAPTLDAVPDILSVESWKK